jgi:hypothetical protein
MYSEYFETGSKKGRGWRDHLKVHPAADFFPLLSETDPAALKELAEDIRQHGQREPASYIKNSDGDLVLLDGRNRLDALEMLGRKIDINDSSMFEQRSLSINAQAFIISKNIHRRHLTPEKKRDLIGLLLKANPEKSDRHIAKTVKASHHTVEAVRAKLESTGQIAQLKKTVGADGKARKRPTKKQIQPEKSTSSDGSQSGVSQVSTVPEKRTSGLPTGSVSARISVLQTKVEDNWAGNDPGDDDETCWRRGLIHRAAESAGHAAYEDWSQFKVDSELVAAATRAAEAWNQMAAYLRSIQNEQEAERGANPDDGLTIPDNLKRAAP